MVTDTDMARLRQGKLRFGFSLVRIICSFLSVQVVNPVRLKLRYKSRPGTGPTGSYPVSEISKDEPRDLAVYFGEQV